MQFIQLLEQTFIGELEIKFALSKAYGINYCLETLLYAYFLKRVLTFREGRKLIISVGIHRCLFRLETRNMFGVVHFLKPNTCK